MSIENIINDAWENRDQVSPNSDESLKSTVNQIIDDLDSGKYLRIRMYINGLLDVVGSRSQNFSAAGNTIVTTNFSFIRGLGEADEITIKVFHNNGDTQNLEPLCSYFSAFKLNI